jgi:Neisseria meningitidis TspB protein
MDHRSKLVALLLTLTSLPSFGGFAQVSPPPSVSSTMTLGGQTYTGSFYKSAANDVSFSNGVRGASGTLNVGGRSVAMPAAYRFAANAGQFAARSMFLNPAVFVGITAASLIYQHWDSQDFALDAGVWKKSEGGIFCQSDCWEYQSIHGQWYPSLAAAANASMGKIGFYATCAGFSIYPYAVINLIPPVAFSASAGYCNGSQVGFGSSNYTLTRRQIPPYDSRTFRPATEAEFVSALGPIPIPPGLPQKLPDPLPIEDPILNPSPAAVPLPQPMRIPEGLPQPIPNTNPQQYRVPVIDVVPYPVPGKPWQVDVAPKDIVTTSPTALPETSTVPNEEPAGTTSTAATPDLCQKNPDILACKKVEAGELKPETIPSDTKNVAINPDSGWGPSSASCPAPRTALVQGITISMPFDLLCDFASGVRPFVLGFAWLSSCMIFVGMGRKD